MKLPIPADAGTSSPTAGTEGSDSAKADPAGEPTRIHAGVIVGAAVAATAAVVAIVVMRRHKAAHHTAR